MPSLSPQELEVRAERAVRRGELLIALDHYEQLLSVRPDDERLRGKIESVRSLLQPSELVHRRKTDVVEDSGQQGAPLNDAEEGELHASAGKFEEAVASYRRAVVRLPKNELLRERLQELIKLAPPGSRAVDDGLFAAERLEQATPAQGSAPLEPARSTKAADAVFRPMEKQPPGPAHAAPDGPGRAAQSARPRPAPLPSDPVAALKLLLERVKAAGRRG